LASHFRAPVKIGPVPLLLIWILLLGAGLLIGSMVATWLIPVLFGKSLPAP
jgi:hypothetical protein